MPQSRTRRRPIDPSGLQKSDRLPRPAIARIFHDRQQLSRRSPPWARRATSQFKRCASSASSRWTTRLPVFFRYRPMALPEALDCGRPAVLERQPRRRGQRCEQRPTGSLARSVGNKKPSADPQNEAEPRTLDAGSLRLSADASVRSKVDRSTRFGVVRSISQIWCAN